MESFEIIGICLLYHVDGDSAFALFIYAKWFHSYMYMKMTKHIFKIYEIPCLMSTK